MSVSAIPRDGNHQGLVIAKRLEGSGGQTEGIGAKLAFVPRRGGAGRGGGGGGGGAAPTKTGGGAHRQSKVDMYFEVCMGYVEIRQVLLCAYDVVLGLYIFCCVCLLLVFLLSFGPL